MSTKNKGFTIVELLIVIVVIAILAAITTVAYNGIQDRARDSARDTAAKTIRNALEMYYADESVYPNACSGNGGCNAGQLSSWLTPDYTSSLPTDPETGKVFQYVRNASGDGYGLRIDYARGSCKYLGGTATSSSQTWWGSSFPICS